MLSCVIFEDEHLLVVNKPAGLNTHSPSAYAGEGLYEWLKHREPRWAQLAIIHRLDKETSGVMLFGKTTTANRSLTEQFTRHTIRKKYILQTDRKITFSERTVISSITRAGEKYLSRPLSNSGERAETHFRALAAEGLRVVIEAEPVTGRTHQIRAQAAAEGFPILGDALYGGTPAPRVFLHAAEISLRHPATGESLKFTAPVDFDADARQFLRAAVVDAAETNAYRVIHGAADGWPGWYVERLGDFLLSQSEEPLHPAQSAELQRLMKFHGARGAYHKLLNRQVRRTVLTQACPHLVLGESAPAVFPIQENGLRFELSFNEGYSVGLFLDQRDNRRRWLSNRVTHDFPIFPNGPAGAEMLNTFAYTCGFSVAAARAGARATSLDLSKKYLEWGRRHFTMNDLDPAWHDFIYGDVFDWLHRLAKKVRVFDAIVLDPPTFSQSKSAGVFQAEKHYGRLVTAALPLLKQRGTLFAATNAARLEPDKFLVILDTSIQSSGRKILRLQHFPQPPDFPVHRNEPAYLKTVWLQVS